MSSTNALLAVREITSGADTAWEEWKQIYFASFPEFERMSDAYFLRVLAEKARGEKPASHMLVLTPAESPNRVIGIAYYEVDTATQTGYIWYIATHAEVRNRGYGAQLYTEICRRLQAASVGLLIFEVEIPEVAGERGADEAEWARKRIAWYRRQGARLLTGIDYIQSVDTGVPPTRMRLMAHPFVAMDAQAVFDIAKKLFGGSLTQTGVLRLE